MKKDKPELALTEYQKALRIDPRNVRALLGSADAYLKMDKCPVAIEVVNTASRLEPGIPADYYFQKAKCLLKRTPPDFEPALNEALVPAIELDPLNPDYYELRGVVYEGLGQSALAAESFGKARDLRTGRG